MLGKWFRVGVLGCRPRVQEFGLRVWGFWGLGFGGLGLEVMFPLKVSQAR